LLLRGIEIRIIVQVPSVNGQSIPNHDQRPKAMHRGP
jgi:hypothetical protein